MRRWGRNCGCMNRLTRIDCEGQYCVQEITGGGGGHLAQLQFLEWAAKRPLSIMVCSSHTLTVPSALRILWGETHDTSTCRHAANARDERGERLPAADAVDPGWRNVDREHWRLAVALRRHLHAVAGAVNTHHLARREVCRQGGGGGGEANGETSTPTASKSRVLTPSTPPTMTRDPSTLMLQQRNAAASFDTCATANVSRRETAARCCK
jgi:hypothetical protein